LVTEEINPTNYNPIVEANAKENVLGSDLPLSLKTY